MAKNTYLETGDLITFPAAADAKSGEIVVIGDMCGVAIHDAKTGEDITVKRSGAYKFSKTAAQALTVGQKVYWDAAGKKVTTTAGSNKAIGVAIVAAAAADADAIVVLGVNTGA